MKMSIRVQTMKNKPREFWLAMPGENYDGCPVAWQTKQLAENSNFVLRNDKFGVILEKPSEIIHVKEVLNEENDIIKHALSMRPPKRFASNKRRPKLKRARKKDL